MVGVWPMTPLGVGDLEALRERIDGYMVKAVREAKVRTTWTDPDEGFEDGAPGRRRGAARAGSLAPLPGRLGAVRRANRPGRTLERARVAPCCTSRHRAFPTSTRATSCGAFALVDPDNRRPVDFEPRRRMLEEVERGTAGDAESRARFLTRARRQPGGRAPQAPRDSRRAGRAKRSVPRRSARAPTSRSRRRAGRPAASSRSAAGREPSGSWPWSPDSSPATC